MEYKGFVIKVKGLSILVIEDPYGWQVYWYGLKEQDEAKIMEEGKRVIDAALEIINNCDGNVTNKVIGEAFATVHDRTVKENTPPPNAEGIARKARLRKQYRNCLLQQGFWDLLLTLAAVFIPMKVCPDTYLETAILWIMCSGVVLADVVGIGAVLAKEDGYALGKKGEVLASIAAGINGTVPSGYGGGLYTGPRARYIGLILAYRVFLIFVCGLAVFEDSGPVLRYTGLCLLPFQILHFCRDIKTIRILNAYNDLDENGHSKKEIRVTLYV